MKDLEKLFESNGFSKYNSHRYIKLNIIEDSLTGVQFNYGDMTIGIFLNMKYSNAQALSLVTAKHFRELLMGNTFDNIILRIVDELYKRVLCIN